MIKWDGFSITASNELMLVGKFGKFGLSLFQDSKNDCITWDIWHGQKGAICSGKLFGNDFDLCKKIVENISSELYQVIA